MTKKMNSIIKNTILLSIAIMVIFASCKKTSHKEYKVAMLAHGTTFDDLSFLQSCKDGIERAKIDFNLIVEYNIDNSDNNYQERLDGFGEMEYDLIIAIGYMWNDAVINSSKRYTKSRFVLIDSELSEPQENAISVIFDVDEAAFPIGYLAAWWADTYDNSDPKLGNIGAMSIPQIRQFIEPYNKGAMRYNSQYDRFVDTTTVFVGDFFNPQLANHLTDSLINTGADIIFGVGSESGDAALLAANESGKWCIGVDSDQYYSFPEVSSSILTSAMKGLDNAIYDVIESFTRNNFNGGGIFTGNLTNNGVKIAPYHDYNEQIPDSIKIEIETIKAGIIDGSIHTGW